MSNMKKAARIGKSDLVAGISTASSAAKARIEKIDGSEVDTVSGATGIDTIVPGAIDIGTVIAGMFPSNDPDPDGDGDGGTYMDDVLKGLNF